MHSTQQPTHPACMQLHAHSCWCCTKWVIAPCAAARGSACCSGSKPPHTCQGMPRQGATAHPAGAMGRSDTPYCHPGLAHHAAQAHQAPQPPKSGGGCWMAHQPQCSLPYLPHCFAAISRRPTADRLGSTACQVATGAGCCMGDPMHSHTTSANTAFQTHQPWSHQPPLHHWPVALQ